MCHMDYNQDPQHKEYQEVKRCDFNLDTIFKIADEVLPTPASGCLVTVVSPEKPGLGRVTSSITCNTMLADNPKMAMQDSPLHAGTRSGLIDVVRFKQEEDAMLSLSDQIPDDAIFEVIFHAVDLLNALICIF